MASSDSAMAGAQAPAFPTQVLMAALALRVQQQEGILATHQSFMFQGAPQLRQEEENDGASNGKMLCSKPAKGRHLRLFVSALPKCIPLIEIIPRDLSECTAEYVPKDSSKTQLPQPTTSQAPRNYTGIQPAWHCQKLQIPDVLKDLLAQVRSGLQAASAPTLSFEGSGGVYFMKDEYRLQNVAVFKPADEEPMAANNPRGFVSPGCYGEGLKRGTRVGAGAEREVAAYILDHPIHGYQEGFAGVPPTIMARCYHDAFHWGVQDQIHYRKAKLGSLQKFVHAFSSCEDMGPSSFPVQEVHKITVLDLRLANADRNGGNILVCKGEDQSLKLVPIDHGYCLPDKFEDCTFEWLYWPQARLPYDAITLKYIAFLDAEHDLKLLQQYGLNLRPQSTQVLQISTMVLKKGAAAGLTPFQIGCIISRQFPDFKSPIELMMEEAEVKMSCASDEVAFLEILAELVDQYIASIKPL